MITKTTQLKQFVLCIILFFFIYILFYLLLLGINFWYIIAKTISLNLPISRKFEYLILKCSKSVCFFFNMRPMKQMTRNYVFNFYASLCWESSRCSFYKRNIIVSSILNFSF